MGTTYKKAMFKPPIEKALQGWHHKAMENRRKRMSGEKADALMVKGRGSLPKSPLGPGSSPSPSPEGNGHSSVFKAFEHVKSRFGPHDRDIEHCPDNSFPSHLSRPEKTEDETAPLRLQKQSSDVSCEIDVDQDDRQQSLLQAKSGHRLTSTKSI